MGVLVVIAVIVSCKNFSIQEKKKFRPEKIRR